MLRTNRTSLMNKKAIKRINGGIAIYYGVSCVIGTIGGVVGIGIWLFKVLSGLTEFSWLGLILLTISTALFGFFGYVILRVGYEEIEK